MSIGYRNRKKAIRDLRKQYANEPNDLLRFWAVEHNDRWSGMAAVLVLRDRGYTHSSDRLADGWEFMRQSDTPAL
jgi:hypothetical protein